MFHIFEVNGSAVILESTKEALQVIRGNPNRTIPEDQTELWKTWAKAVLTEASLEGEAMVDGHFDPDAARVVIASRLSLIGEAKNG